MSVLVVTEKHIDAIVTGVIDYLGLSEGSATSCGKSLWLENHKAYAARYPHVEGSDDTRVVEAYAFKRYEVTATTLRKAIECLETNCVESETFDKSAAKSFLMLMSKKLGHIATATTLYDAAPWGIE